MNEHSRVATHRNRELRHLDLRAGLGAGHRSRLLQPRVLGTNSHTERAGPLSAIAQTRPKIRLDSLNRPVHYKPMHSPFPLTR